VESGDFVMLNLLAAIVGKVFSTIFDDMRFSLGGHVSGIFEATCGLSVYLDHGAAPEGATIREVSKTGWPSIAA
jgi:hypothetical protein